MSATSLQADIISELDSQTTAGRRIYYGTRLQTSILPAITFEITTANSAALGNQNRLCVYEVSFNAVAASVSAAALLNDEIRNVLPISLSFDVVCTQFGSVLEPTPENGEEAGLYIVGSQYTFYQLGP